MCIHRSRTGPVPTYSDTSLDNLLEVNIFTTLCADEMPEAVPNNLRQNLGSIDSFPGKNPS